jgi:hypothetical protein
MSTYPATLDTLPTTSANSTASLDTPPALHNDVNSAMNAVQATLGVNPQGAAATVTARIKATENRIAFFTPADNCAPSSTYATLDTRNSIPVLDFDSAASERAVFGGQVPAGVSTASGIAVAIRYMATSATSGAVASCAKSSFQTPPSVAR